MTSTAPKSRARRLAGGLVAGFTLLTMIGCTSKAAEPDVEPAPPAVATVAAQRRSMPLERTYTGRVEAVQRVELRPRVAGALEQVFFREGAVVNQGDPLFLIDQRPFIIALRRAEAEMATVGAQLDHARRELERAERLYEADAVSAEELQRRHAEATTLIARLEAARAAVEDAELNLDFTTVEAPIRGRIGRAEVTLGNLVKPGAGEGTLLATLHSVDPVYVYFDLDPATAAEAMRSPRGGWAATVTPLDGDDAVSGPIDFVDNGVGHQTGTLRVRAALANAGGRLIPGAVVRVVFRYGTTDDAVVVPDIAIGTDQGGRYVLVAGADGTVEYRATTAGSRAGDWRVVTSAVRPGDKVILPGLPGLRPGMRVTPVEEVLP